METKGLVVGIAGLCVIGVIALTLAVVIGLPRSSDKVADDTLASLQTHSTVNGPDVEAEISDAAANVSNQDAAVASGEAVIGEYRTELTSVAPQSPEAEPIGELTVMATDEEVTEAPQVVASVSTAEVQEEPVVEMAASQGVTEAKEPPVVAKAIQDTTPISRSGSGPSEGIKVHGHWSIEVRDPDGTLVSYRAFDNALTLDASNNILPEILEGTTFGVWLINLDPESASVDPTDFSGGPCLDGSNNPARCFITENPTASPPPNSFGNLALTRTTGNVRLSGAITAAQDGDIGVVATNNLVCGGSTTPNDCRNQQVDIHHRPITATKLEPAVPVQAGQQAQITVDISFN